MRRFANPLGTVSLFLLLGVLLLERGVSEERELRVPIDLAVDESRVGQIETMITEEGKIYLPLGELKKFLKGKVRDDAWEGFGKGTREGWVELERVSAVGLEVAFDKQLLALRVSIPAELRASRDIFLSGQPSVTKAETDFPAAFSGYVNLSSSASVWYEPYNPTPFTVPLFFSASPVVNYKGWVMEAGMSAATYPKPEFTFEYERLVKDFEKHSLRFTLGTLGIAVQGFQSTAILEGVSILKDASLFRKSRALSREELVLEKPADVHVYVNDQLVRTLNLEAGRHRLLNFPYVTGVNDVRIVIKEESAPERVLERFVAFDGRIQPEGEVSFSLGAGIPRWDPDVPMVQGAILWGVTPWSTLGGNLQGNPFRQLAGVEALLALPLGILLGDFALSFREYSDAGWAASVKYRISFPGRKSYPMAGLGVQYKGSRFHTPLEPLTASVPPSWELNGMISQPFPFGLSLGISGTYTFARAGENRFFFSLTALQTLTKGVNLLFSVTVTRSETGITDTRGALSLTITSPEGRRTSSFTSSFAENSASASVQVRPEVKEGTLVLDGGVEGFPLEQQRPASLRAGGAYGNRFFEGSLTQTFFKGSSNAVASRLTAQGRTALSYAEGLWAISKPIPDSFALAVPVESLENETLWVSSTGSGDVPASKKRPGLLLLNSYEKSQLLVDAPYAPAGVEVGESVRVLRPAYRSGTVVRAGTKPTVFVEGTLRFRNGGPVAYRGGTISWKGQDPSGKGEFPPIPFFTDDAGVFQAYGLVPGEYDLRVAGIDSSITIRIPPEASGFVSLGTLEVNHDEKK